MLLALTACSTTRSNVVSAPPELSRGDDSLSLRVQNLSPATVTALLQREQNGERTVLGPVQAGTIRLFRVPYAEPQVGLSFDVPAGPCCVGAEAPDAFPDTRLRHTWPNSFNETCAVGVRNYRLCLERLSGPPGSRFHIMRVGARGVDPDQHLIGTWSRLFGLAHDHDVARWAGSFIPSRLHPSRLSSSRRRSYLECARPWQLQGTR